MLNESVLVCVELGGTTVWSLRAGSSVGPREHTHTCVNTGTHANADEEYVLDGGGGEDGMDGDRMKIDQD